MRVAVWTPSRGLGFVETAVFEGTAVVPGVPFVFTNDPVLKLSVSDHFVTAGTNRQIAHRSTSFTTVFTTSSVSSTTIVTPP